MNAMGHYIEVENNVKLFVEDIGSGTPVIFIHGWPLNHTMFEYQFTLLSELGYRCIGIDQRGFGKSDAPASGYGYDRLADDLRVVIDQLKLDNAVLVGFSVGGAISIRYMANHGGHGINKLALLDAAAPSFTVKDDHPYGMSIADANDQIKAIQTDRPIMLRDFGKLFLAPNEDKTKATSDAFNDWLYLLGLQASAWGTVHTFETLRDEDLRKDLSKINVPTAIFQGALDQICPPVFAELLEQGISDTKLVSFKESGHGLMFDEQDKFNRELLAFLEQK